MADLLPGQARVGIRVGTPSTPSTPSTPVTSDNDILFEDGTALSFEDGTQVTFE
jgi:hypothetical protein